MEMKLFHLIFSRVVEKVYDEDGHCLPLCLPFKQASFKSPQRLIWQIEPELGVKIKNAVTFAQTVSCVEINFTAITLNFHYVVFLIGFEIQDYLSLQIQRSETIKFSHWATKMQG